ncbi:unnamed protein product [Clonostachys byssicola]|uniref:Utp8 beta-propeller domain-containing protein n=1 Tax=Clonostachys byssicola TaxID=160290 RepID=A0A9N9UV99_9HYPO|nr:unnamed protein product [Clonostachys byssicola]
MASGYKINKPYVLATLPRPLHHTGGRIAAREVYAQKDGVKRKRTELAVGVDGETTSIYDVPASRLITSYPIPPQDSFTCPPYSIRIRRTGSSDVSRYTFIATNDGASQKITLFRDVVHRDGKTTSTTKTQTLRTSPVRYITTAYAASATSAVGDLVVVCENGEVVCLTAESLAIQWNSASRSIVQDVSAGTIDEFTIEHVTSGSISNFTEGVFKGRPEVFAALPRNANSDPTLLAMVSRSLSEGLVTRRLVVLAILSGSAPGASELQRLTPLDVSPIVSAETQSKDSPSYQFDSQSGILLQLQEGALSVFDISAALPKLKSVIPMEDAQSFTRLSRPFVLSCSNGSLELYNYQYRSVHAQSTLDLSDLPPESDGERSCQLIAYMRSQDLAVALVDNVLVSIHIEPPKSHGKRRRTGLLIDSIGRGTAVEIPAKKTKSDDKPSYFSHTLPGTITETYLAEFHAAVEEADKLLSKNKVLEWEEELRKRFYVDLDTSTGVEPEAAEWNWHQEHTTYPSVDRRWVIYAIGQVFSAEKVESVESRLKLRPVLPDSNVTTYLAVAGHLTLSNLKSAFREELEVGKESGEALAADLIVCLTEADPSMTLLYNYLRATKLGESEVLLAIRALMRSMDLIPDANKPNTKLLKNEAHQETEEDDMELDDLERKIAISEHYLGDDSSVRSRGLTLAFAKLWRLPSSKTVKALRSTLQVGEILSLLHLLRVELVQGAWTSLYLDPTSFDSEGNEPPPDGVIALISDLLGRCLDAVGSGGWLVNDAMTGADNGDTGDFITALKLEVAAALEGVEQVVKLQGYVSESVRYGLAAQKSGVARQTWNTNKPITMHMEGRESRLMPLGLKVKALPTKEKVVSGGEVVQRSMRETGHLISQKVEAYSLEKLVI